jgi:cellulose synthase/poly-beta-1,6-N-acetylglucosamine synthase-like glycosyltransferase
MPIILAFVLAPAILASIDSFVRAALVLRSRSENGRTRGEQPRHWLVIVPARAEGTRLQTTMSSIAAAMRGRDDVTALLLLDGEDDEAAASARENGFAVRVKLPPGPTKAAALAWLVAEESTLLENADAILIIDAGSRVKPDFFERFVWPEGADAVQTHLSGVADSHTNRDTAAAAALSERFAQSREDRGREAFGWNVRLRGTGTAFRPKTFADVIPRLVTRIEDHEASLLLTAAGAKICLAPDDAIVFDEKPSSVDAAASQRARWLLGRYELLMRRGGTFASIMAKNPVEGAALFAEIFGRPLSLTIPLRVLAGAWAIRAGHPILGGAVAGSAAIDVLSYLVAARGIPRGSASFAASWLLAVVYAPRALTRWLRTDR